ncbi:MAG: sulfate adenylyltransferase subunit CysN [Bacteroidales bacterium]|nr:sulfate adenylyltransferase subunit CysN [Bacteroidales bacterium]MCF8345553.1 sulfate adenylyltransferase subunit CysN [Bacteroidales bacterium]MCF8351050.1 sulfate adenylyltransferase subunit CysN [Bacteroidales bacterium]MCF8375884.1 sulfate adenylyltransferase subunit CysN [Bacteroidales bacterium]MCF8402014.1 sulfate adenylyltransferase subunit CysN [Bacteroidales bacterium]
MDIKEFLDQDQKKDLLRLLTAGSVDDGKSTLIGRLLFDSKKLYEDHLAALERDSKREGHAGGEIDYALLLDGLKAEREQGITIDVAYRYFSTNKRKFIIADTPGHEQYTRNMITGGSTANLAILLVDARHGVITQTKRHTFLVSLLGIKHVVVAINKMDLVDYSKEVYDKIVEDYKSFVTSLGIPDINFIPLSALKGDNVVDLSERMPWYHGTSMLEFLETVHVTSDKNFEDLRYPVQYVIRPDLKYRGFAGRMASGILRKGDEVMVLPSRQKAFVKSIDTYNGELAYAFPPQSVTVALDREIDVSRGEMLVPPNNIPRIERHFEAMLVWMDEKPMDPYTQFYIKQTTNNTKARIDKLRFKIDVNTLEKSQADHFELNEIGRVVMTTVKPLFFDPYKKNHNTGSFVLIDPITHNTVAVGMILDKVSGDHYSRLTLHDSQKIVKGESLISEKERQKRYNQKGSTLWITGLHGSGKNELAYSLEKRLFEMGATVVLLDGKSVRSGLSRELDFSPADRAEHLRRVAHICKLLNDQGVITICSFVSPDENTRTQVAEIIGENRFKLIHLDADIEFAKKNDKYGLYKMAENAELKHMPGIDDRYEEPQSADITIKAEDDGKNVEGILEKLAEWKIFPRE